MPGTQTPHLRLTKTAAETSFNAAVGDADHYTLVATNDGNVTLTGRQHHRRQADADLQPDPARPWRRRDDHLPGTYPIDAGGCGRRPGQQHRQRQWQFGTTTRARAGRRSVPVQSAVPAPDQDGQPKRASMPSGVTLHYTLLATNDGNVTADRSSRSPTPSCDAHLQPGPAGAPWRRRRPSPARGRTRRRRRMWTRAGSTTPPTPAARSARRRWERRRRATVPGTQTPHLRLTKTAAETSFSAVGRDAALHAGGDE